MTDSELDELIESRYARADLAYQVRDKTEAHMQAKVDAAVLKEWRTEVNLKAAQEQSKRLAEAIIEHENSADGCRWHWDTVTLEATAGEQDYDAHRKRGT